MTLLRLTRRLTVCMSHVGVTCVTADEPSAGAGLRGTLYAELDGRGQISYVREGCEPILKPGEATEALLKAATANMERPPKPPPTYTEATPTTASGVATYLWKEAYPKGATPDEAVTALRALERWLERWLESWLNVG